MVCYWLRKLGDVWGPFIDSDPLILVELLCLLTLLHSCFAVFGPFKENNVLRQTAWLKNVFLQLGGWEVHLWSHHGALAQAGRLQAGASLHRLAHHKGQWAHSNIGEIQGVGPSTRLLPGLAGSSLILQWEWTGTTQNRLIQETLYKMCITVLP